MSGRAAAGWLSLSGAAAILGLKLVAYALTGSVALLSDAAESVVNVAAALALILALRVARAPADYRHPYGHQKAEYLSSAFEAALILLAGGMILLASVQRLIDPIAPRQLLAGVVVAGLAAVLNGLLASYLFHAARRLESPALAANARHLRTDVWTSLGVLAGVGLVALTGWAPLDPLIALLVAANIVREGYRVLAEAASNLLDERLPEAEEAEILKIISGHPEVRGLHRLRTRRAGNARFLEVDVFVAPAITVAAAHEVAVALEDAIHARLPNLVSTIHIEPFQPGRREGITTPHDEFSEAQP